MRRKRRLPGDDPVAGNGLLSRRRLLEGALVFSLEALSRYPRQSRIAFVECAGNSGALNAGQPQRLNVQGIHGLLSCSDWTGVPLATLLEEAGIDPRAKWVIAEGADSASM